MRPSLAAIFLAAGTFLTVAFPQPVAAGDGGELSLRLSSQHEIAWVHDPSAAYPDGAHAAAIYLPRFGTHIAYGVTHWLEVQVGVDFSLSRATLLSHAVVGSLTADLSGSYRDMVVPAGLALTWNRGGTMSLVGAVLVGPLFALWEEEILSNSDHSLPLDHTTLWHREWMGQVQLVGHWRPVDWFGMGLGPSCLVTSAGDVHLGAGVWLEALLGVGPNF